MMSDQGWGTTSSGGVSSGVLLETEVSVVTKETCATALADFPGTITDNMICAGGVGKDHCYVSTMNLIHEV